MKYLVVYDIDGDVSICVAELTSTQASALSFKPSVCAITLLANLTDPQQPIIPFDYLNDLEDDI